MALPLGVASSVAPSELAAAVGRAPGKGITGWVTAVSLGSGRESASNSPMAEPPAGGEGTAGLPRARGGGGGGASFLVGRAAGEGGAGGGASFRFEATDLA